MNPALIVHRIGHRLHRMGLRRIAWGLSWFNRLLFGCWIPSSAQIGKNARIGYWGLGVVIHQDAVIGDDCLIGQNVTIGRNPGKRGVPKIGSNVYVGAGSVVAGDIQIGDFVVIGANSVVLRDVPSRSLVAGAPAKVIRVLTEAEALEYLHE
jgi:serine O-acetyltransferase